MLLPVPASANEPAGPASLFASLADERAHTLSSPAAKSGGGKFCVTQNLPRQSLRMGHLGPSCGHLGAILGLFWSHLGLSWGHLGAISGLPGAPFPLLSPPPISVRISKTCVSSMRKACFLESSHLGCFRSYCWSRPEAILGYLGLSSSHHGAILGYIEPSWAHLGHSRCYPDRVYAKFAEANFA